MLILKPRVHNLPATLEASYWKTLTALALQCAATWEKKTHINPSAILTTQWKLTLFIYVNHIVKRVHENYDLSVFILNVHLCPLYFMTDILKQVLSIDR